MTYVYYNFVHDFVWEIRFILMNELIAGVFMKLITGEVSVDYVKYFYGQEESIVFKGLHLDSILLGEL